MDDTQASSWLTLLSHHLVHLGASRSPVSSDLASAVAEGLYKLPPRLRSETFSAAASLKCGVHLLLNLVPSDMHTAVVATTVSADKTLAASLCPAATPYLRALISLPATPPSLLSLRVTMTSSRVLARQAAATHAYERGRHYVEASSAPFASSQQAQPPSAADEADHEGADVEVLLSAALRHHTGLEQLSLAVTSDALTSAEHEQHQNRGGAWHAPSMQSHLLPAAVATLPLLRSLTLGSCDHPWPAATLPFWRTALSSAYTPQLRSLTLNLAAAGAAAATPGITPVTSTPGPTLPHPHTAPPQPSPQHALTCLSGTLAAAGSLTALEIHMHAHMHAELEGSREVSVSGGGAPAASPSTAVLTVTAPLPLPHLRILTLTGAWLPLAGPLLHHLSAPLTTLVLSHLRPEYLTSRTSDPDPCHLFLSLPKFTLLQQLHFDVPMCVRVPATAEWWEWLVAQAERGLAPLTQLRDLHITAGARVLFRLLPAAFSAAASLHRLRVSFRCVPHGCVPSHAEWSMLLTHLRVPGLRELRLWMVGLPCDHIPGTGSLLSSLSALTCLRLTGYDSCLPAAPDIAGLATLTRLQHLALHEFTVPRKLHAELGRALCALRALTELSLTGGGLRGEFADAVASAAEPWPELWRVRLALLVSADADPSRIAAETLVRALARMHAAHACELTLCGEDAAELDGEGGAGYMPMADGGAGPPPDAWAGVPALAASLGVRLVFDASPDLDSLCP